MTANREPKRKSAWQGAAVICLLLLLPVGYALSIGPLVWMYDNGYMSEPVADFLGYIYTPLHWTMMQTEPTASIYEAYVMWWRAA